METVGQLDLAKRTRATVEVCPDSILVDCRWCQSQTRLYEGVCTHTYTPPPMPNAAEFHVFPATCISPSNRSKIHARFLPLLHVRDRTKDVSRSPLLLRFPIP